MSARHKPGIEPSAPRLQIIDQKSDITAVYQDNESAGRGVMPCSELLGECPRLTAAKSRARLFSFLSMPSTPSVSWPKDKEPSPYLHNIVIAYGLRPNTSGGTEPNQHANESDESALPCR